MRSSLALLCLALFALTNPVLGATLRELDGAELRRVVREGDLLGLKQVIASLARQTGGEPVEARAFASDGVFYRVVLKTSDGSLISIIIDARTGEQVAKGSALGKEIVAAAKTDTKSGAEKSEDAKSKSNAGGNGNGNGNGNSGGNGNGNGNSGGNGNGNGNSGGNGGGNGNGNGNN